MRAAAHILGYVLSIHVLSVTAFGFVAFVLVFVHPASQASRGAAYETAAASNNVTADAVPADMRPRLAASK